MKAAKSVEYRFRCKNPKFCNWNVSPLSLHRFSVPLLPQPHVRLVHPPALAYRALLPFPESGLQFRSEFLDPAVDVGMIDRHAALCHHFLQVTVAERISQVPADTSQDDVFFEAVAFEVDHAGSLGGCWGPRSLPKL